MKNAKILSVTRVALLGTSTLAFATPASNTVGFDMNGASDSSTVTNRAVTQTGDDDEVTLESDGSSSASASYELTAVGDSNVVATAIAAVSGAFA